MCTTLLMQLLNETQRHRLEVKLGMNLQEWFRNNENNALRLSFQQGEARGEVRCEAKAILKILLGRGLIVAPQEQERILHCQDEGTLDRWLQRALTARSTSEVLEG